MILCIVHDARKHEEDARKCYAVAPKFILGSIGMWVFEPLADLLFGLGFASTDNGCIGVPYFRPELDILFGGVWGIKTTTPPIREALQPSAFGGS